VRCCARELRRPARQWQRRHSGRGAAPTAVLARRRARSRQGEAAWARNCARSTGSTGFGRCTVGVGSLAPWRVGPPEQAAAGVEPPTHGARDRARWARHGWAAWAGAGRGRDGCVLGRHKRTYAGWAGQAAELGAGPRSRGPRRGGGGAGPSGGEEREKGIGVGRPNGPGKGRGLISLSLFFIYFYYFSLTSCENH
jgi:hypothetical protein